MSSKLEQAQANFRVKLEQAQAKEDLTRKNEKRMWGGVIPIAYKRQISGIIHSLEWLFECPDGDWVDGHGEVRNKAEDVQAAINRLRELVSAHLVNVDELPEFRYQAHQDALLEYNR